MARGRRALGVAALAAALLGGSGVAAQPADFFAGKTISIVVGYAPGGLYDITARLLSRHMGRHLPGQPTIIVQNMPGASSITAIVHLYNTAPRDGTVLGMIARSYAIDPLFNAAAARYDARRFNPIGSTSSEVSVGVSWYTTRFKTFEDTFKSTISVGATGMLDDTGRHPLLTRNLTGAKLKIVTGYPGGNDVTMAMEEGEVDGRWGWSWGSIKSRARAWLEGKKINILFQMAVRKAPDLPDTPLIMDYAKTERDRQALELLFVPQQFAWPLVAPPEVPADRLATLRRGFDETMKDDAFRAEAAKLNLEIEPLDGAQMEAAIRRILSFDKPVVERARELTTPPN